jgi:hypothetical protein
MEGCGRGMALKGTMKGFPAWSFKSDSTFQLNLKLDKQVNNLEWWPSGSNT